MENLRWIILAAGLVIVLIIYLLGRKKARINHDDLPLSNDNTEWPSISTHEERVEISLKDSDIPFVASEINSFDLNEELVEQVRASVDEVLPDVMRTGSTVKSRPKTNPAQKATPEAVEENTEEQVKAEEYDDDLVIIHVRARNAYFKGEDLLKVVNHQQLKFGDMSIYHAYDDDNVFTFSMSNMLQPGHFDPEHIAEMRTPGVILFMQLSLVTDTELAFEKMLNCAQTLARELDGTLTTAKQHAISDEDIEAFKQKATYFKKSD